MMPLDAMREADLDFFAAWNGEDLAGVGAIKRLDERHGEIKSMHTAAAFRRRRVGQAILDHILNHAAALGLSRLSLETGAGDFFVAARALYARNGFSDCPPLWPLQTRPEQRLHDPLPLK